MTSQVHCASQIVMGLSSQFNRQKLRLSWSRCTLEKSHSQAKVASWVSSPGCREVSRVWKLTEVKMQEAVGLGVLWPGPSGSGDLLELAAFSWSVYYILF